MRISIIGGGPAGLYFAILMKKQSRAHEIKVLERNAPDDTFGQGIVFSDTTFSCLRDSDQESYQEITASFEKWVNVNVVHRGRKIPIRGSKFSAMARIKLLHILQRRCRELDIDLRSGAPVADIDSHRDFDLLVGADGLNSATRTRYAEHFQPKLCLGKNRYIWYGTRQLFSALTLTFRETDTGVFVAHSYKFNKEMSTFIVECDAPTWKNSGFDKLPPNATSKYLAEVFGEDLHGHELLSNNSKWASFVNVTNAHWSHENVVLLGDALHTAHFSIGSGTKLALEDAIALCRAFAATERVRDALCEFERVRKPEIEEWQAAAGESQLWFENIRQYMNLDPLPFAYELMTRSKRGEQDADGRSMFSAASHVMARRQ